MTTPLPLSTLQVYVSQLRKALGAPRVETRSPGYVLAVEADQVDAARFERLVAEGRSLVSDDPTTAVARLTEALGLWRGPALADFTYEDFARAHVARLEELRLVAVEERTDAELALGRHGELAGPLRSLVEEHPLRERLWGQLVLALYRSGRQAEALRALAEVRRLLGGSSASSRNRPSDGSKPTSWRSILVSRSHLSRPSSTPQPTRTPLAPRLRRRTWGPNSARS